MADIFLSYSRADRPLAQDIAAALEAEGFSVWWDKVLRAGQTYDEVTESMLRDSSVVVVLWSQTSVKSKWVRAEATLGQRSCELVPAMIEEADRPIMFELTQTADLIGWAGDRNEARWGDFVADIKRSLDKHNAAEAEPAPAPVAGAPAASSDGDATIETVFWTSIKDGDDPADFEAYLSRYPEGHYAALAQNRLKAITGAAPEPVAAAPAPAPAAKPAPTPTPAPTPKPAAEAKQKKSSSPMPLLIGAVIVLGGGWFGYQTFMNQPDTPDAATDEATTATVQATCDVCPSMVELSGGTFTMGSPDDEANRSGNEGPQREVSLSPFAISATEVTWAQWQACVDDGGCSAAQGSGEGSYPVTGVNWDDAVAYTTWLTEKSGRRHRLPSEAQWEFVARAGTQSPYWWGTSFPGPGAARNAVADTAAMPDNPFGVSGMLGNVREWVADCYVNNYRDAPTDGRVVRDNNCARPVVRGGSWKTGATEHRAANRARYGRTIRDSSLGFRVVAEPAGS